MDNRLCVAHYFLSPSTLKSSDSMQGPPQGNDEIRWQSGRALKVAAALNQNAVEKAVQKKKLVGFLHWG